MLENKPGAAWQSKRRLGIGSSEVGVIAGLSSKEYESRTPFDVAYAKLHGEDDSDTPALYSGRYLERAVLDWAEDQVGEPITRNRDTKEIQLNGLLGLATVDGMIRDKIIVEAKTARSQTESWGDGGSAIPDLYAAQVQWQMGICGCNVALVPTLFKTQDKFIMYEVPFDRDFFGMLCEAAELFWAGTVAVGQLPEPGPNPERIHKWLNAQYPNVKTKEVRLAEEKERDLIAGALSLRKQISALQLDYDLTKTDIEKCIGHGYGIESNGVRAVWGKPTSRVKTDWKAVAEELAGGDGKRLDHAVSKFTKTFNGGRVLRITERGNEDE